MRLIDNTTLYTAIKEHNILSIEDLEAKYSQAQRDNLSLTDLLLESRLIEEENLVKLVGEIVELPYVDFATTDIDLTVLNIVPEVVAKKQHVIAFKKDEQGLHIALVNPQNSQIISFIQKKVGIPIKPYIISAKSLEQALSLYAQAIAQPFDELVQEALHSQNIESSIATIVDAMFSYAHQNKASDIHLQPYENECVVRLRIDGVLHDITTLPCELYSQIVAHIKALAKLTIDDHATVQDGKLQHTINDETIDIRVSVVPSTKGERVVLRLLSAKARELCLANVEMREEDMAKIKKAYEKPYGLILASGPMASGKTTTLYGILKLLNKKEISISTIEDPVEYDVEGINQMQINVKTNLTFANGLKSILRQDPNIILVGEMRDIETAEMAVNSAITGHLVLATLLANDTTATIARLIDLGIDPLLLASTLNIIIAHRLVRRIHTDCRINEEVPSTTFAPFFDKKTFTARFKNTPTVQVYKGKGCKLCHNTGYEGRVGLYEVLEITEEIKELIKTGKDAKTIQTQAKKQGMQTLAEQGIEKVLAGHTTIDEVMNCCNALSKN